MTEENNLFTEMPEESVWELIGDMVTYNTSDFNETAESKRRATEEMILYSLFDIDYAEETEFTMPSGALFSVTGASEAHGMYLIAYNGEVFACEMNDVEYSSVEVE